MKARFLAFIFYNLTCNSLTYIYKIEIEKHDFIHTISGNKTTQIVYLGLVKFVILRPEL
jgi:hypothetical protein